MKNHLRDFAKKRFNTDLDALPDRENWIVDTVIKGTRRIRQKHSRNAVTNAKY